jgi:CheY-like chemotaxis protein
MTIGSAACLPRRMQAPLSPFPTARRARLTLAPDTFGEGEPPLRQRLCLAAEDPPRGRILVVDSDVASALELQRLLRDLGYRVVGPASSSHEARQIIDRAHSNAPISCALLDVRAPGIAEIAEQLDAEAIPFLWTARPGDGPPRRRDAPVLAMPCDRRTLSIAVARRIRGQHGGERLESMIYPKPPPQEAWPRVWPQL